MVEEGDLAISALCTLDELDEVLVLPVRLPVVVGYKNLRVMHAADCGVAEVEASARFGCEGVLLALAIPVLADQHLAEEDEVLAAPVGLAVYVPRRAFCLLVELDPFAVHAGLLVEETKRERRRQRRSHIN